MSVITAPAVSRDEQITAIKNIAEEYNSVTSMTTTPTHVIVVMDDTVEAGALANHYRHNGWWSVTADSARFGAKWYVRVPINN